MNDSARTTDWGGLALKDDLSNLEETSHMLEWLAGPDPLEALRGEFLTWLTTKVHHPAISDDDG